MKHNGKFSGSLVLLVLLAAFSVVAQAQQQAPQQLPAAQVMQQGGLPDDPIRQLNLTAEQREQIRSIREQNKPERAGINQRLAEANRSLEVALDAENPDEGLVEQRLRDVAAAQASAMRMRILTEVRIRRVLTVEQRLTLRSMQKQARETRLENNNEKRQIRRQERIEGLRNQRNGMGPILQQRRLQRRPRI